MTGGGAPRYGSGGVPQSRALYQVTVTRSGHQLFAVQLHAGAHSIGRLESCAVFLDDPAVSRMHANLTISTERVLIEDLESDNGVIVDGERVVRSVWIPGKRIVIPPFELDLVDMESLQGSTTVVDKAAAETTRVLPPPQVELVLVKGTAPQNRYLLGYGRTIVGRAEDCGVLLPETHVSRHHAEFELGYDNLVLRDLGSTIGTYVGGRRIQEVELRLGDRVLVGSAVFELRNAQGVVLPSDHTQPMARPMGRAPLAGHSGLVPAPVLTQETKAGPEPVRDDTETMRLAVTEAPTAMLEAVEPRSTDPVFPSLAPGMEATLPPAGQEVLAAPPAWDNEPLDPTGLQLAPVAANTAPGLDTLEELDAAPRRKSHTGLMVGAGAAAALLVLGAGLFAYRFVLAPTGPTELAPATLPAVAVAAVVDAAVHAVDPATTAVVPKEPPAHAEPLAANEPAEPEPSPLKPEPKPKARPARPPAKPDEAGKTDKTERTDAKESAPPPPAVKGSAAKAAAAYEKGRQQLQQGDRIGGVRALQQALKLGLAGDEAKQARDAVAATLRLLASDAQPAVARARDLQQQNKLAAALGAWSEALAANPFDDEAAKAHRTLKAKLTQQVQDLYDQGMVTQQLGRTAEACQAWRRAQELSTPEIPFDQELKRVLAEHCS